MKSWTQPLDIGENRLPAGADLRFPNRARVDLNGTWAFSCQLGAAQPQEGFDAGALEQSIRVPGCWEPQGFGKPYYFACGFPACVHSEEGHIPELDGENIYVGRYARRFAVPQGFGRNGQAVLRFGSVKSAFYCWLNGSYVGMNKASMLPTEFDVTDLLRPGENLLTVQVFQFSDATYLEDQDMWHLAGICRDVWLEERPRQRITDLWAKAAFSDEYASARLDVTIQGTESGPVSLQLLDGDTVVCRQTARLENGEARLTLDCGKVRLWSAEAPELYRLSVRYGEELCELDYGFREVRIEGERLLLNGMPLKLRGVNYHAFTPEGGYYVPREALERDLTTMKRFNINAIRTSHYPQDEYFYSLCDRLGLYVMDECNLESHGVREKNVPGDDPRWTPAVLDRMERMVLRDRNHPCVVLWSLGNESNSGENHHKMRAATLALDNTRPIHYEGGADLEASDFVCVGYSSWEREKMFADGLNVPDSVDVVAAEMDPNLMMSVNMISFDTYEGYPIVATEYMHSMGNSGSEMEAHMDVFEGSDRWCGGFIWDFKDKVLPLPGGTMGRKNYGYGGDFGPGDQPGTMCANGVCAPDGTPHQQLWEVKYAYQPVKLLWDGRNLTLENRNSFLPLEGYDWTWEIACDGEVKAAGALDLRCPPRQSCRVSLPEAAVPQGPGRTTLTVIART